ARHRPGPQGRRRLRGGDAHVRAVRRHRGRREVAEAHREPRIVHLPQRRGRCAERSELHDPRLARSCDILAQKAGVSGRVMKSIAMDKLERLAHWKAIAVDETRVSGRSGVEEMASSEWTDEDSLFGFLDCFRPNGRGIDKVFAGIVRGDEIVQRLLRVYE